MSTPPGQPGIDPTWTSSAKTCAGTSAGTHSRVWFTISYGILDEVYFPFIDQPNTRDLGLIVADGSEFFSEEKRDADSTTLTPATVMWTANGWSSQQPEQTIATRLGVHFLDVRTNDMAAGTKLVFTFRWENGQWEGHNFDVKVV